jgi:membrane protease YdiL (CAAX protease family)
MSEGNDRLPRAVVTTSLTSEPRVLIAPWWHTAFFVLFTLTLAACGAAFQNQPESGAEVVRQSNALVPLYLTLIGSEWLAFLYIWWGLSLRGRRIGDLTGYLWSGWRDVLRDIVIALVLWIVCRELSAFVTLALGPNEAKSITPLLPEGPVEMLLWVALSISAGVCEEVMFRGYLQKQFSLITRSAAGGLIAQSVLFGITHGYQGFHLVVIITIGGAVYGLVAHWRQSLRPVMMAHAWSDIVGIFPCG